MNEDEKDNQLSILLTKQNGWFAKVIYWLSGRKYTHASIRLDEMGENFYSFNFKGFCMEPLRYFRREKVSASVLYQLKIDDAVYESLQHQLAFFQKNKAFYRYSKWGVCLCLLHIPHHFGNSYFCSEFVAKLLKQSGAIVFEKNASLCLPNTLENVLRHHSLVCKRVVNPFA